MKKKFIHFICYLLGLCLVFVPAGVAYASSFTDIATDTHVEAIEALSNLGLVSGTSSSTYEPNEPVTRAQMATFLVRALGFTPMQANTVFSDVPATHWASGYISYANALGIVCGYDDDTFGPEDYVTYEQAVAMTTRALGYTPSYLALAYPNATYPMNSLLVANNLDILNKVSTSTFTRGDMAQLLYNVLDCDIHAFSTTGVDMGSKGDTILARTHTKVSTGLVALSEDSCINLVDLAGKYAVKYYNTSNKLVSATIKSTALTGKFVNGTFTINSKGYVISATGDIPTFVNGVQSGTASVSAIATWASNDAITLNCAVSGQTITTIYSAEKWVGNDVIIVKSDLATSGKIAGYTIPTDEAEYQVNGVASIGAITTGAVVTFYTANNTLVKADVSTANVTGQVTRYAPATGIYTINGVDYKLASGVSLTVGNTYKCALNAKSVIVKAELVKDIVASNKYAIYVGSYTEAFGDLVAAYYTSESTSTYIKNYAVTTGSLTAGDLFTFTLNSAGKINTVTKANTAASVQYTGKLLIVDGKTMIIAPNAVIWAKNDTKYTVIKASDLAVKTELVSGTACQYMVDTNGMIASLVIDSAKAYGVVSTKYFIASAGGVTVNAKGALVNYYDGYMTGAPATLLTTGTDVVIPSYGALYAITLQNEAISAATPATAKVSGTCTGTYSSLVKIGDVWYELAANTTTLKVSTYANATVATGDVIECYDTNADTIIDLILIK